MRQPTPYARAQRRQQARWKQRTSELPDDARRPGRWGDIPCGFILPVEHAACNIWAPIREEVIDYFQRHRVAWHDEDERRYGPRQRPGPSPHLLDSQICAVNFWWGLSQYPEALAALVRHVVGDQGATLQAPTQEPLLCVPEWIGTENYLGERGDRQRGKFATSADFLLAYRSGSGQRRAILLESKYTESYLDASSRRFSDRGTDRAAIYRRAFEAAGSPIRADRGVALQDLLVEPFDQHLRQQLLASAMQRHRELGFEIVTCVHASPMANVHFHEGITAAALDGPGQTVGAAWRGLLQEPSSYLSYGYEALFDIVQKSGSAGDEWLRYQRERYGWGPPTTCPG